MTIAHELVHLCDDFTRICDRARIYSLAVRAVVDETASDDRPVVEAVHQGSDDLMDALDGFLRQLRAVHEGAREAVGVGTPADTQSRVS